MLSSQDDASVTKTARLRHQIQRVRHEVRRRALTVTSLDYLTPRMLRVGLASPELNDFVSLAADDHIKLFFPVGDETVMRDFTPAGLRSGQGRAVDRLRPARGRPRHANGRSAKIGDTLQIGGPRGSAIVPDDFDWYLLVGDETALPAMARRVEELRARRPRGGLRNRAGRRASCPSSRPPTSSRPGSSAR
jgi:NADPH-dependent ferric siderophore reductase